MVVQFAFSESSIRTQLTIPSVPTDPVMTCPIMDVDTPGCKLFTDAVALTPIIATVTGTLATIVPVDVVLVTPDIPIKVKAKMVPVCAVEVTELRADDRPAVTEFTDAVLVTPDSPMVMLLTTVPTEVVELTPVKAFVLLGVTDPVDVVLVTPEMLPVSRSRTLPTEVVDVTPLTAIDTLGVNDPTDPVAVTPEIGSD